MDFVSIFNSFLSGLTENLLKVGVAIAAFVFLQIMVWFVRLITRRIVHAIDTDNGRGVADIPEHVETTLVTVVTGVAQLVALTLSFRIAGFDATESLGLTGVIGLAFALASKDLIHDAVGGIVALSAQHVRVGYWLEAADAEGFIVEIGLFSTKLQDPTGVETYARNRMYVQDATIRTSGTEMNHTVDFDLNPDNIVAVRDIILNWAQANPHLIGTPACVTVPGSQLTGSGVPYRLVMPVAPENYVNSIGWFSENAVTETVYKAGHTLSVFDIGGSLTIDQPAV